MNAVMKQELAYPLSTDEILTALHHKCRVIDYNTLAKYNSIDDLLNQSFGKVIILFEFAPRNGHWCSVLYINKPGQAKSILFFDSYGTKPDKILDWCPKTFLKLSGQKRSTVLKILYNSKYQVYYNQHHLQKESPKISTCGRWCILMCLHNNMDENDFYDYIKQQAKAHKVSLDVLSVIYTQNLI